MRRACRVASQSSLYITCWIFDGACVRKPPYCPCQAFVLCVDVFHIGIEVMDLLLDVGLVLLDPP